tara:strand:+ start:386 stop:1879 length:1494 start_codon:yes stop_codon:yes gene_type:complete
MIDSWLEFQKLHAQFALGHLDTETPNPMTKGLGELCNSDPVAAWNMIAAVDHKLLSDLKKYKDEVTKLGLDVERTLASGGRIFLSGCGATGRLSLSLEALWRFKHGDDRVISFMAGGDSALIRAIEKFEDYPELGSRQLKELGFTKNDLLIASTEGGETPFVIGSAIEAANIGGKSWLTFCNPSSQLTHLKRCDEILNDSRVQKISLKLGPQALSGSTRMQASSALMLVAGLSLFYGSKAGDMLQTYCDQLTSDLKSLDLNHWANLSIKEASIIQSGECVSYVSPKEYAICILTDTTERGPTFSMTPFEHKDESGDKPSLNYMVVDGALNAGDAFVKVLGHVPRTLNWPELDGRADDERLNGFELTKHRLQNRLIQSTLAVISYGNNGLSLEIDGDIAGISCARDDLFYRHLLLKMVLNTHSTILMGRLGRFESNVMTWVRPSNLKLIDRSLRYAGLLLSEKAIKVDQNSLGLKLFELLPNNKLDEPIVKKLVDSFS